MTLLAGIFAALSALAALAFILLYAPRHWWTHVTGRSIMATKVAILLLAVSAVVARLDPGVGRYFLTVAWIHMAYVMVWRVYLMWAMFYSRRPANTSKESS